MSLRYDLRLRSISIHIHLCIYICVCVYVRSLAYTYRTYMHVIENESLTSLDD